MQTIRAHHENITGGIIECNTNSCDIKYRQDHETLKLKYANLYRNYQEFKTKVFEYAGGILKRKKRNYQS